ncbi:hypothetical protein K438DRAFT_1760849 [Mycena galopus ATCC 62051]|nr:hypothetical protein K438DRAFT_1760849 [Mycena galopus ATCC 62051]
MAVWRISESAVCGHLHGEDTGLKSCVLDDQHMETEQRRSDSCQLDVDMTEKDCALREGEFEWDGYIKAMCEEENTGVEGGDWKECMAVQIDLHTKRSSQSSVEAVDRKPGTRSSEVKGYEPEGICRGLCKDYKVPSGTADGSLEHSGKGRIPQCGTSSPLRPNNVYEGLQCITQ